MVCMNLVRFTPDAGRHYSAQQAASGSGCRLSVIDQATGKAPADLETLAVEGACR